MDGCIRRAPAIRCDLIRCDLRIQHRVASPKSSGEKRKKENEDFRRVFEGFRRFSQMRPRTGLSVFCTHKRIRCCNTDAPVAACCSLLQPVAALGSSTLAFVYAPLRLREREGGRERERPTVCTPTPHPLSLSLSLLIYSLVRPGYRTSPLGA